MPSQQREHKGEEEQQGEVDQVTEKMRAHLMVAGEEEMDAPEKPASRKSKRAH